MRSPPLMLASCAALLASFAAARSIISTFADANCQESITSLDGPNGYPNGTCTDLRRSGPYGSFQIVGLDAGCTVTIYMDDLSGDICSGFQDENTRIANCYNSTWAFYSIDFCDPAAAGSTDLPTLAVPLPTSPASSSSSSSSTSASASASSAPQESNSGSSTPVGAIVGGVVGGVLGLALIIGATVYFTRRSMRGGQAGAAVTQVSELHTDVPVYKHEVYEKTGTEPGLPPVELPTAAGEDYDRYEEQQHQHPKPPAAR